MADYTPFSISEIELFSDTLHLTDCTTLNKKTPSVPIGKFIKDNEKYIPSFPYEFNSDSKIKKLKIISFPLILPIIKGYEFEDGEIDDKYVQDSMVQVHDLYAEWVFYMRKTTLLIQTLQQKKLHVLHQKFTASSLHFVNFQLKSFSKQKNRDSPFAIIKNQVDNFIRANKKGTTKKIVSLKWSMWLKTKLWLQEKIHWCLQLQMTG